MQLFLTRGAALALVFASACSITTETNKNKRNGQVTKLLFFAGQPTQAQFYKDVLVAGSVIEISGESLKKN